jgi:hypothetical protein
MTIEEEPKTYKLLPKASKKRGRPRGTLRAIASRTERIEPTPELVAKRIALCGTERPELSSYTLGVILARRLCSQDEHDAGLWYGSLYRLRYGRWRLGTMQWDRFVPDLAQRHAELPEEQRILLESRFQKAKACLIGLGRNVTAVVEDVSVFDRLPAFALLERMKWTKLEWKAYREMRRGLKALYSGRAFAHQ